MSIFDDAAVLYDSSTVSFDGYPVVPNFPVVTIEAAFGYGVATPIASMVWTSIGKWVLKVDTQRGKQHERNVVQAGTATFLLDNRDGRFSPWNTSSPYSGNVLPMVPIRIVASWAGVDYPVWFGYVESWPQKWHDAVNSEVEVVAVDGFKNLSLDDLNAATTYRDVILADTPTAYWRLNEPIGAATAVDLTGNGHTATYSGIVTFSQPGALVSETDKSVSFGDGYTARGGADVGLIGGVGDGTAPFTLECWFKIPQPVPTTTPNALRWIVVLGNGAAIGVRVNAGTDNGRLVGSISGTGPTYNTLGPKVDDNVWHYAAFVRDTATTWTLYCDGIAYPASGTPGSLGTFGTDDMWFGRPPPSLLVDNTGSWGPIDEVAVYDHALTATQIGNHYQAATGNLAAKTGARINTVLDTAGWPAADRDIAAGVTNLPAETRSVLDTKALAYIQDIEKAEDGLFYMAGDGKATFRSRDYALTNATSTTSQATLGGGVGELPYRLDGTDVGLDDVDIWNNAGVSRIGGALQVASDTTSRNQYGPRSLPNTTDLMVTSDEEAANRAAWIVAHYKDPHVRVGAVNIDARSDPTNTFPKVLGLDLLARVTFKRATLDGGSTFQADQLIEGVDHHITPSSWRTVWHLAPADTNTYWIWGTALWGTTTKWAY